MTAPANRTRTPLWMSAALVLVGLSFGLVLAEVVLRITRFEYAPFYQPDPLTGTSLRPDTQGWQHREGHAFVVINSQGMHDRERPLVKPPDTYRVVVLGDSYAEAMQVAPEKSYTRLLERGLQACGFQPGRVVDVINAGVSGFGTGQELIMLQKRALKYQPDLVLLTFFAGNDVRNNSRDLETDVVRPFYSIDGTGALKLDDSFAGSDEFARRTDSRRQAAKELSKHFRILQLVYYVKDLLEARAQGAGVARPARGREPGLDDRVFVPPQDDAWRNAWSLTERLIVATRDAARAGGADFALVTASVGIQVSPDKAERNAFAAKLGVPDLLYPERRLEALGESAGIRVIALAPELQKIAEQEKVYLHGFANTSLGSGHWNEAGHAAAARILVGRLCGNNSP